MKKIVSLAIAFFSVAMVTVAQPSMLSKKDVLKEMAAKRVDRTANQKIRLMKEMPLAQDDAKAANQTLARKLPTSGVWYSRPKGTYFYEYYGSKDSSTSIFIVPPFQHLTYKNQAPAEIASTAKWLWVSGSNEMALDQYADASNNLVLPTSKTTYWDPLPTLRCGTASYKLPADWLMVVDSVPMMLDPYNYKVCTNHPSAIYEQGGPVTSPFVTDDVMDFDMDRNGTKENVKLYAIAQVFEKPATSLYLHDFSTMFTAPGNPLAGGHTLKAKIYTLKKDERGNLIKNQWGKYMPDELIDVMTATEEDVVMLTNQGTLGSNNYYMGQVRFKKTTYDEFDQPTSSPVAITDDFMIMIDSLDKANLHINLAFCDLADDEAEFAQGVVPAYEYYYNTATSEYYDRAVSYYSEEASQKYCYAMSLFFYGEMDAISVSNIDNINYQTVSVEGGNSTATAVVNGKETASPAVIYTNYPMLEREGDQLYLTDNYDFEDMPEWAQLGIDDTYFEYEPKTENEIRGMNLCAFIVDALPAGEKGRSAAIRIVSKRGAVADNLLYIAQGEVEPMGVTTLRFDAKGQFVGLYNMAGQLVDGNAKGLVVKSGKKYMKK